LGDINLLVQLTDAKIRLAHIADQGQGDRAGILFDRLRVGSGGFHPATDAAPDIEFPAQVCGSVPEIKVAARFGEDLRPRLLAGCQSQSSQRVF